MSSIQETMRDYIRLLERRKEIQATVMDSYIKKRLPDRRGANTSNRYEFLYEDQENDMP